MDSLPDFIDYELKCLSVGLNPSILSAQKGYYFANPRNRFWRAFNQSGIIGEYLEPESGIHARLMKNHSLGFTDIVKRPSRMGNELRAEDFKRDVPLLKAKIATYQPQLLWFHGKIAIKKFLQYGYGINMDLYWGANFVARIGIPIYISPNPSPANARYSLDDLIKYYRELAKLLNQPETICSL